jgi:hypothetical protein
MTNGETDDKIDDMIDDKNYCVLKLLWLMMHKLCENSVLSQSIYCVMNDKTDDAFKNSVF